MRMHTRIMMSAALALLLVVSTSSASSEEKVVIEVDGWKLVGILNVPESGSAVPAVILCHQFNSNKAVYDNLAKLLAEKGIASLRLDGRGHGESTNKGRVTRDLLRTSWPDVVAAHKYLKGLKGIKADRIGTVSASYSGESVARAGREYEYAQAYVVLSSGTMSKESIADLKNSAGVWWFVAAKDDPRSAANMQAADTAAKYSSFTNFEKGGHGTNLFRSQPDLEAKIADWFAEKLK